MNAQTFSKTNQCDADWVVAMGNNKVRVLTVGQSGTVDGYPAKVLRHYRNGMYEIKTQGGVSCIDAKYFS